MNQIEKLVEQSRLNITKIPDKPPVCLQINDSIISTYGNFSAVTGRAKSRKTYLISALAALYVSNQKYLSIEPQNNENKICAVFDTEQGIFNSFNVLSRVYKIACFPESKNSDKIQYYHLRKFNKKQRIDIIEQVVKANENIGLIIIDGVRDLVSSINNEDESTYIASKLLQWSEVYNIHICVVLHQNKVDNNLRGHLGTEILNKAECIINVQKDSKNKDISIVECKDSRNKEFNPFAFSIDENDLPVLTEYSKDENENYRSKNPKDYENSIHINLLKELFPENNNCSQNKLYELVRKQTMMYGIHIGENKSREFVKYYQSQDWIKNNGTANNKNFILNDEKCSIDL
jgi:PKD repeat protein